MIIVYYADNSAKTFDYSIGKEKEILEKMKYQVLSSKRFNSELNSKFEIFLKLFLDEILLFILFMIPIISTKLTLIPCIIGYIILPISIGLTGYKLNKYNKIRNDIKKHMLFINNEDNLNIVIRNNLEATKGLDEKLREKVFNNESNNFSFTLNTIDNMEYKELREVYSHVDAVINNKPKILTKRK